MPVSVPSLGGPVARQDRWDAMGWARLGSLEARRWGWEAKHATRLSLSGAGYPKLAGSCWGALRCSSDLHLSARGYTIQRSLTSVHVTAAGTVAAATATVTVAFADVSTKGEGSSQRVR